MKDLAGWGVLENYEVVRKIGTWPLPATSAFVARSLAHFWLRTPRHCGWLSGRRLALRFETDRNGRRRPSVERTDSMVANIA